jgi:flagellar hook-length control protein FliK
VPPAVPQAFEHLLTQIAEDPSLRIALMPNVARVSIDTGEAGRVSVQLKVNDGIAEVRASGPGAQLLEQRQGELRVALAHEGLAMGHFDLTQSGGQQRNERPEPVDRGQQSARAAPRATSSTDSAPGDGHLHVKA